MRILINDFPRTHELYTRIFQSFGYEKNELIFQTCYEDTHSFIVQQLEVKQRHIDLIINGEDEDQGRAGVLQADRLRFFKNSLVTPFSKRNFRIAAIPLILYSEKEPAARPPMGYAAIIQKNQAGFHDYFIGRCESAIKSWRRQVLNDLETLRLRLRTLPNFIHSQGAKDHFSRVVPRAEHYFVNVTEALSLEFIKCPGALPYDWIQLTTAQVERPYDQFKKALLHHLRYNKKVTERIVWHTLLRKHDKLLLRDVHHGYLYERNLREARGQESQECDFILTTEFPGELPTTFLEVKREDKQYYVRKHQKRPQPSAAFQADLQQIWTYYKYTINPVHKDELVRQIGYATRRFDFLLLAGRKEEKEEMREVFDEYLQDHFAGIRVDSFEEYGENHGRYIDKFFRLAV